MPHPNAYGIVATIKDDGPTKTVILTDQDANVLGELAIDAVPLGFRVNAYNADESPAGTLLVRA